MLIARAGIMVYWRYWFEVPGNDCLHPSLIHAGEVKKVDVIHMKGSYILLGWGLLIGVAALIWEVVHFSYKNRDRTGGKISIVNMIHEAVVRLSSDPKYHKWADSTMHGGDVAGKTAKLSFIHPKIKAEVNYGSGYSTEGGYLAGQNRGRAKANQPLNYNQLGLLQSSQIRNIYPDPTNFHYFSYAPLRPSYKPKSK